MSYNSNLEKLRKNLIKLNANAIVVSMNSEFSNKESDISDIGFISGFSGSNGRAVVSLDSAILAVDGRYTKQANEQTDASIWTIEFFPKTDTTKMIAELVKKGETLIVGSLSVTYKTYISIVQLSEKIGFIIKSIKIHPVSNEKSKAELNSNLFLMSEEYMGETVEQRISRVKETLNENEGALFADKARIGWIFGIRMEKLDSSKSAMANCIAFIPKKGTPVVFCDLKLTEKPAHFDFKNFDEFEEYIKNSPKYLVKLDYKNTPAYFALILKDYEFEIKSFENTFCAFETIKNKMEIENQKIGAELTALAFIKTLAFVENSITTSEIDVAKFFEKQIMQNEHAVGISFNSISSFKDSTCIVHYNPYTAESKEIVGDGLFLFDAGAHFDFSTTDMTRVLYRGDAPPTDIIETYSVVLKSLIMFSSAHFPDKSFAACIDTIARFPVWKAGYDYSFGTGHGIGCFGNVHETLRVSQVSQDRITRNMMVTVEPGIYNSEFGIRLENMLLTVASSKNSSFIEFETLNFIPFCRKLINKEILDKFEINWLNNYHKKCFDKFYDTLKNDAKTLAWLEENTKEI
ncbi:Xaa-Pro aminopeptidase [Alphaproteobacteria bacterium]|nr:Xaa-Pro aminopeptidase [Alphaproteobacteria bacterium]